MGKFPNDGAPRLAVTVGSHPGWCTAPFPMLRGSWSGVLDSDLVPLLEGWEDILVP